MKVAILGPYPLNNNLKSVNGGVQAVVVNMVKGLSRFKDLDIHIVTASPCLDRDIDIIYTGVHVHAVVLDKRFGNITLYWNTRKRISGKIKEIRPDLVHTHMFGYYTLAALNSGYKRIIVSTHGISNKNWGVSCGILERVRRYLQDYTYIRCANKAENIIMNSPYARKSLSGINKKKVYGLNNPVSDLFFDIDKGGEEEGRILFVGNVCEAKGIMTLLRSLNLLRRSLGRVQFMIAGRIMDRAFYSKAVRFIRENGLDRFVNFLGHLDEDRLKEEYRKAAVFVFPSQQDVAPLAVLQAMAMGKAIVASRVGGIPYIIDDNINGFLIENNDYTALADKISFFLNDSGLRKRFGLKAQKKVSRDCRISVVTDRLYEIYKEIAG